MTFPPEGIEVRLVMHDGTEFERARYRDGEFEVFDPNSSDWAALAQPYVIQGWRFNQADPTDEKVERIARWYWETSPGVKAGALPDWRYVSENKWFVADDSRRMAVSLLSAAPSP